MHFVIYVFDCVRLNRHFQIQLILMCVCVWGGLAYMVEGPVLNIS